MNTPTWDPLNGGSIEPNVRNEFGTLKTAILNPIATPGLYAHASGTDIGRMEIQFSQPYHNDKHKLLYAHQRDLTERGVRIVHPHHPNLQPTIGNMLTYIGSDIYCRDFLGVVDDTAILTTLSSYRNDMRSYYERILEQIPKGRQIRTDDRFSWGNAILADDTVLVGLEHQSYLEEIHRRLETQEFMSILGNVDQRHHGIRAMQTILEQIGGTRKLAVCSLALNTDLDMVLAPLPRKNREAPREALVSIDAVHPASIPTLAKHYDKLLPCTDDWRTLACNILWLDPETPLVSAEATKTIRFLRGRGYNVQARKTAELKSEAIGHEDGQSGGWRCVTGVLERASDYDFD